MLKRKKAMESLAQEKICPQCGATKWKSWRDLTDDRKFLVEKIAA